MARIYQHRDPELSLLQSAIDEVVQKKPERVERISESIQPAERPGVENPMVFQAAALGADIRNLRASGRTFLEPGPPRGAGLEGVAEGVQYCASLAYNYAKAKLNGNTAAAQQAMTDLTASFGSCDPRYAQAAVAAARYFRIAQAKIPYIAWRTISDFVIDDGKSLPDDGRIAVVGDWGTGQKEALAVLRFIAAKDPDVVVHLGDVYYAGTEPEQQHYFFDNWCQILGLSCDSNRNVITTKPVTFSLPGNHDMYCGGQPYYAMIRQLGQAASFFCLRNRHWQFIGLDTGYFDHDLSGRCTHLAPGQPEWLAHKMATSEDRQTVLLSHHQLFSNAETFDPKDGTPAGPVNPLLMAEVKAILPSVSLWLWGHQHQFVAYADPRVRARCIGHGAYPVGISEIGKVVNSIALDSNIAQQQHGNDFWDQGYALIELDGPHAKVTYYEVDDTGNERANPSSESVRTSAASLR